MPRYRDKKVAKFIHQEIGNLLLNGIKDPRLSPWTTVVDVKVTGDLRHATVFFSVRGTDKEKKLTSQALDSAKGFIRSKIGEVMRIKFIPELHFKIDDSLERGEKIIKKIDNLSKEFTSEDTENPEDQESNKPPFSSQI